MKVAITAKEPKLDGEIDPRFGRAAHFVFVETDSMEYETIENPNIGLASGAGIQSARLIVEKGVEALLSGSCGPNAYEVLEAAGVRVYIGVTGDIPKALEALESGDLLTTDGPNVEGHNQEGAGDEQQTPKAAVPSQSARRSSGGSGRGGRGQGAGRGQGKGSYGKRGGGHGQGGGRRAGVCVCPDCGAAVDHVPGVPCSGVSCPQCGSQMVRE